MILIGSRALAFRAPQLLARNPLDFDFIATKDEAKDWFQYQGISNYTEEDNKLFIKQDPPIEFDIIQSGSSNQLLKELVEKDPSTLQTKFGMVPNLNLLFTIKSSHKYKKFNKDPRNFWKHCLDYHRMKECGCQVLPEYLEFFKLREKESYNYAHPKLNVNKENFFKDDQIEYIWDHDDLHKSVALNDKPAYLYYLKDGEQVQTDKNKFFACSEHIRLSGVIEEACVLAIERSLVPHPNKLTPKQAWTFALGKVCSSITSGYFREYCFNNIFEAIKNYPENYFDRFNTAVKEGKVRKLK